jgi:CBS domain-containing protein
MRVQDIASSPVVEVGLGQTLREAARVMTKHVVGSAVVRDGEQLIGMLTERDVLTALATGADPDATRVQENMTPDVVTVGPDWDLYEAAREMGRRHIRHLVVYDNGHLLGILSVRDVLDHLLAEASPTG